MSPAWEGAAGAVVEGLDCAGGAARLVPAASAATSARVVLTCRRLV